MAEGSVCFLLMKLTEILQEENQLLTGVRAEAKFISDELEFMKAFLRVADAMEERDPTLEVLVKKVRDVAYDMEDVLDGIKLRLTHDHGNLLFACFKKSFHTLMNLRARHVIASRIQGIKSRAISISEANQRYLIRNNIIEQGSTFSSVTQLECQGDGLLLEEADLVGIEKPKRKLIELLLGSKSGREVVSVVGMGGLGKSTLAKKVYDDPDVKRHFKFCAWITVSQSYKIEGLLKNMIQQFFRVISEPDPHDMDSMDYNKLRMLINKFLQQRKYLVVLDDVWQTYSWDAFQHALPNNNFGSRILVTTRNNGVASISTMEFPDNVYSLKPLSQEESWTLLGKKIFQNNSCPPHLKRIAEKILGRCEGLPLAIVAVSGVLATKDKNRIEEWEMVHRSLGARLEDNDRMMNMRKILSLSYNDLPYYLKSCLLYFSIFPEGNPIKHMKLIRLWIAEGFVEEKQRMTLEEVAEDYMNELIKRNLVQVAEATDGGQVKTCRIHDLLREIMVIKAKDQNFVAFTREESMMCPKNVRRLSIHNAMPRMRQLHIASQIRAVFMFRGVNSFSESPALKLSTGSLRLLNVLDLEGTLLKEFPTVVVSLVLLKYLCLRNTKVTTIPSSIGKLQNLETLDLKHAHVVSLPDEIVKLQKLRHLLVYRYEIESNYRIHSKYGFMAPAQIGSLRSIQKLGFIEANQGKNLLLELGKLNKLRRLGIVKLRKEDGKTLCSSIQRLINLRALSVTSINESEIIDLNYLSSPPQFLQRLYLTGRLDKLLDWISSLDNLVKVKLKFSRLSVDPLSPFQHLPSLVHLQFVQAYDGELLCFEAKGFQRLRFLGLKLDRLRLINIEQGAMPSLEKLIFKSCKSLQRVPLGIEYLTELKLLGFFDMPKELIMTLHPKKADGDYLKVAHVLDVYSTYWNNGNWDIFSLESFKKDDENSDPPSPTVIKHDQYVW